MKILLICIGDIRRFPPALSIWNYLLDLGHEVYIFTDNDKGKALLDEYNDYVTVAGVDYYKNRKLFSKFFMFLKLNYLLNKFIKQEYTDENTLLWIIGNDTMKLLANKIIGKKYVLHFLELSDKIKYYSRLPFPYIDITYFCSHAYRIIACEENRAYIMSAHWKIAQYPCVIPNKPYFKKVPTKNSYIQNDCARGIIQRLADKKIILYQGNLSAERPLNSFIDAIDSLGDEYAFVVMSQSENLYKSCGSKNYYYIPYISAPHHLEVTSHAYIGIVTYIPTGDTYHALNAMYCAPNKIYEYSMFSIPMIGNLIPGLQNTIDRYACGVCITPTKDAIADAIQKICENYATYSRNSRVFYDSTDIGAIIQNQVLGKNI